MKMETSSSSTLVLYANSDTLLRVGLLGWGNMGTHHLNSGRESQNQHAVHADSRWVLGYYRSIIPLEDIYPLATNPIARGMAMVDYTNCLSSGLYPDRGWAEWYLERFRELLGDMPFDPSHPALQLPPLKAPSATRVPYA